MGREQQVICAVSTPHGYGGISVLRLSGRGAFQIVKRMSSSLPQKPESHRIYWTVLKDQEQRAIDEVLVSYFQEGSSFTGEEVVEISCHGNPLICQKLLFEFIAQGARAADRGEFSYRAFLNNKMDLIQAEGVLDLIESQSDQARKIALEQLRGDLSNRFLEIEKSILRILAHLEADIDFSTEGLPVKDLKEWSLDIEAVLSEVKSFLKTYQSGKKIRDGIKCVLLGRPNVGKSSLLNLISQEEKAIVTPQAGTTRDLIEAEVLHGGVRMLFVDSAGIRQNTSDEIEKLGMQKSRRAADESDYILYIFDLKEGLNDEDLSEIKQFRQKRILLFGNKMDLVTDADQKMEFALKRITQEADIPVLFSRAINAFAPGSGSLIKETIFNLSLGSKFENAAVLSQSRHYEGLLRVCASLEKAREEINKGLSPEFVAISLKESLLSLHGILGKQYDDQIVDQIFKEFCLGK